MEYNYGQRLALRKSAQLMAERISKLCAQADFTIDMNITEGERIEDVKRRFSNFAGELVGYSNHLNFLAGIMLSEKRGEKQEENQEEKQEEKRKQ